MKLIIKKSGFSYFMFFIGAFLLFVFLFGGMALTSDFVVGTNITNDTAVTKVNVINSDPILYRVEITTPSDDIDLNAGGTALVNCTGYVHDLNGWDDIINVSSTFYHIDYGNAGIEDKNHRYINNTCNCTRLDANNATCSCFYSLEYYAYNGSWVCNMTVQDDYGLNDTSNSTLNKVNTVLGVDVPPVIDFRNMSATETSTGVELNVSNWGNVIINLSVRGWGGDDESAPGAGNWSMVCSNPNSVNISTSYERYSIGNATYGNMTPISNVSTPISNLTIVSRTNDDYPTLGQDVNKTYWRLYVPSGVTGTCNGTVLFLASEDSP